MCPHPIVFLPMKREIESVLACSDVLVFNQTKSTLVKMDAHQAEQFRTRRTYGF